MTKKTYMLPTMKVVEMKQRCAFMADSTDGNGMNKSLQAGEVDDAW